MNSHSSESSTIRILTDLSSTASDSATFSYSVDRWSSPTWVNYTIEESGHASEYKDDYKFHISVLHDLEVLKKTYELITPILQKSGIKMFKNSQIYGEEELSIHKGKNTDGKAFCVFMQATLTTSKESNPAFWANIIKQIETTLEAHKIPPHPIGSQGDGKLAGKKYIYYRNPNNVAGYYVAAEFLSRFQFTRHEAQNLSESTFMKKIETLLEEKESKNRCEDKITEAISKPVAFEFSTKPLSTEAKNKIDSFGLYLMGFTQACFGSEYGKCKGIHLCHEVLKEKICDISTFTPYLQEVATHLTTIQTKMLEQKEALKITSTRLSFPIQNIIPALYHYFFKPLYMELERGGIFTREAIDAAIVSQVHPEKLITEMVKCCLRDPAVKQIHHDEPRYVFNLSSEKIQQFLEKEEAPSVKSTLLSISA